jgi:hypothetical protein
MERFNYPVIGYECGKRPGRESFWSVTPIRVELVSGRREVMEGDYILPVVLPRHKLDLLSAGHGRHPEHARVLTISEAYYGVGHYQIVAISVGSEDGVEPGHTFSAFRPGKTIRDDNRKPGSRRFRADDRYVTLPDEYAGQVMVFRAFDHISYAIVLDGRNAIRADDRLDHPDRRL